MKSTEMWDQGRQGEHPWLFLVEWMQMTSGKLSGRLGHLAGCTLGHLLGHICLQRGPRESLLLRIVCWPILDVRLQASCVQGGDPAYMGRRDVHLISRTGRRWNLSGIEFRQLCHYVPLNIDQRACRGFNRLANLIYSRFKWSVRTRKR